MKTLKTLAVAAALSVSGVSFAAPASASPVTTEAAKGEFVTAHVNGLVCDFCAQAIQKVFGREAAVASVNVNLGGGVVEIAMKPGQTMDDAAITRLIRNSGYALVKIERAAPQ
ncbi:heavy-metal-associated domain-containing protein [Hyphomonas sp.]|uniref:heavy-metal-associated domain-containing protein n=1 Tax=Hyphomonas sp. TaxID=87 RepID=UPI003919CDE7